jgi:hypothetical protein
MNVKQITTKLKIITRTDLPSTIKEFVIHLPFVTAVAVPEKCIIRTAYLLHELRLWRHESPKS